MKSITLALGLLTLLLSNAFAEQAATSKAEFCANNVSGDTIKSMLLSSENRLTFTNRGGLANGGVCWWHSRFTRKALYLAIYRPDLPKPSNKEAAKIVKAIRMGKGVVEVPGFKNLSDFSRTHRKQIQDRLEKWQIGDGFLRGQWAVGLWGGSDTTAAKMQKRMDDLFQDVMVKKDITYQVLQLPGIVAHAWLVVNMEKTSNGYKIQVIDSNYSSPRTHTYKRGDTHLTLGYFGKMVGRTGKRSELKKMKKIIKKYCK
ncbi:MAG: hypothetical protein HN509_10890 [Halobacteriovoraceae bacterium]|jgi:hypothetical protein|nr:hypothetical protein [Halobacteriovoraceae bacterium]